MRLRRNHRRLAYPVPFSPRSPSRFSSRKIARPRMSEAGNASSQPGIFAPKPFEMLAMMASRESPWTKRRGDAARSPAPSPRAPCHGRRRNSSAVDAHPSRPARPMHRAPDPPARRRRLRRLRRPQQGPSRAPPPPQRVPPSPPAQARPRSAAQITRARADGGARSRRASLGSNEGDFGIGRGVGAFRHDPDYSHDVRGRAPGSDHFLGSAR